MKLKDYINEAVSHGTRASKTGILIRKGYDIDDIGEFEDYLNEIGFVRFYTYKQSSDKELFMQCDQNMYAFKAVASSRKSGLGYFGEIKVMLYGKDEKILYTAQFDNRNDKINKDQTVNIVRKNSAGYNVGYTSFEKFIEDIVYAVYSQS